MVRVFKIADLQTRKQALVAENEVYRQTLRQQVENLRLYRARIERNSRLVRSVADFLLIAAALMRVRREEPAEKPRPRSRWQRALTLAARGWRFYRRYWPVVQNTLSRLGLKRKELQHDATENEADARIRF